VTLFLPLVLLGPVMMLVVAVLSLAEHGPLGVVAAVALVVAVVAGTRLLLRAGRRWWAGTRAPVLPTTPDGWLSTPARPNRDPGRPGSLRM